MKITRLETLFVNPRWVFLKMHTDEGLVGWGEPIVEGWSRTTAMAVEEMGRYLIGQDPRRIEHHWQALYRGAFYRGGPVLCSAISGIEQAMWDILGKSLGVPIHQLLGGAVRDRIRVYCHVGGSDADSYAQSGRAGVERGFNAVKTGLFGAVRFVESPAFVEEAVQRMAALREGVGDSVDIGIDFHGRVQPAMAIQLCKALEPYRPMFVEEPCLPENVDAMVTIARSTSIPIATGERLFTSGASARSWRSKRPSSCNPTSPTLAASWRSARSPRWRRRTSRPSRRTARSARSRSPLACRWMRALRTSSARSRSASARATSSSPSS
jgi:galactonate dehydratase